MLEKTETGSSPLRRRISIFMTGVAVTGLYAWIQPATLGTLEANSAQAAAGSTDCAGSFGDGQPLTLNGQAVRFQSRELCNNGGKLNPGDGLSLLPTALMDDTGNQPRSLLRESFRADGRRSEPEQRFADIMPRMKPEADEPILERATAALITEHTDDPDPEDHDLLKLAALETPPGDDGEGDDGGESGDHDDGGESGGEGGDHDDGGESGGEGGDHDDGGESGGEGGDHDDGGESGDEGGDHDDGGESGGEGGDHDDGGESGGEGGDHDDGGESGGEGGESGGEGGEGGESSGSH
jgi:hypothetical protein